MQAWSALLAEVLAPRRSGGEVFAVHSALREPRSALRRVDRRAWIALAIGISLYVAVRAWILYAHFDAVCMPSYELGTIGNLAEVTLEGRGGAAPAAHFDNVGGHIAVGWMAVPFYALFGSTYLSLKLVPTILGILTVILVARLLWVHFGSIAAVIAAFLFALAPPTLLKYSVIAKGNHFENLFFQFMLVSCFFELHTRANRRRWLCFTGLAGGIAVAFYFGALLTLGLLALVHVLTSGVRRSARDIIWAAPAFVVGVAPLLWLDLDSGGRGRNFLWARMWETAEPARTGLPARLWSFLTTTLPAAGCFEDLAGIPGRWAGYLFLAGFAAAWIFGVIELWRSVRERGPATDAPNAPDAMRSIERDRFTRWKVLPFLLHLPAMALLVSAFDFPFKPYEPPVEVGQYRYLVPHFAFACVLIAYEADRRIRSRAGIVRASGVALCAATLLTGLFTMPPADGSLGQTGRGVRYDGYWFPFYARVLLRDAPWNPEVIQREIAGFRPVFRRQCTFGVAYSMAWKEDIDRRARGDPDAIDLDGLTKSFPGDAAIEIARGAGSYLRLVHDVEDNGRERAMRILNDVARSNHPCASYLAEGLSLDFQYPLASRAKKFLTRGLQLREHCPDALRPGFERGLGIACGRLVPRGILCDLTLVHSVEGVTPAELCDDFAFGMGWGAAEADPEHPPSVSFWRLLPRGRERAACQGFGAGLRHAFGRAESERVFSVLRNAFSGENAAWAERGLAWENYPAPYPLRP